MHLHGCVYCMLHPQPLQRSPLHILPCRCCMVLVVPAAPWCWWCLLRHGAGGACCAMVLVVHAAPWCWWCMLRHAGGGACCAMLL
jgi:hypothetical protein